MKVKRKKKKMTTLKIAVGFACNVDIKDVDEEIVSMLCYTTRPPVQTAMTWLWTQCRG